MSAGAVPCDEFRPPEPEPDSPPALSRDAEEYLTWLAIDRGRAANTIGAYRRDLVGWERHLQAIGIDLDAVDATVLERFVAERQAAGLSAASAARAVAAIRGLFRFRLEEDRAPTDPLRSVQAPRVVEHRPDVLDEATVLRLLAVPGDDPLVRRDRAVLELLYGTGMRVSEAVGLRPADLHWDAAMIQVLGKGGRERLVPLGHHAALALASWLDPAGRRVLVSRAPSGRHDGDALFCNARGRRLTRQGVWWILDRRARAIGLGAGVHPHILRHCCATHMLAHGADLRVVQELLGHASIATTQRYTRVSAEHLRAAYDRAHPRAATSLDK